LSEPVNNPVSPKKPLEKIEFSNEQQKEIKKLEKQIVQLENEKAEILEKFNSNQLNESDIHKYSIKLKEVEDQISVKETKWLELVG
ncbi:MAG: hypothetical protein RJA52_724, partial [Bacteroidota bacterium]